MLTTYWMRLVRNGWRNISWLGEVLKGENGQGLVEYGLIISFVVIISVAGLSVFGVEVNTMMQYILDQWPRV